MPWPLRLYPSHQAARDAHGFVPVGAMWPVDVDYVEQWLSVWADNVAPKYLRDWKDTRPPMFVKLPDGTEFCIDTRARSRELGPHGEGWTVTGEPPAVTLEPSINIVGSYHGYITAGVITDDCEGRTFPNARGFE
jgi:hypothetical protein